MKILNDIGLAAATEKQVTHQSIDAIKISEPRLESMAKSLQALLEVVQLEAAGKPITPSGFRLRNPNDWAGRSAPAFSEVWHVSSTCNMRCPFCYEEGDPEDSSTLNDYGGMAPMAEFEARLKVRKSCNGSLFRPITKINEIFCNPNAIDMLERVNEEAPDKVLTFVTNGTYLTEDVVRRLSRLRPILFNFSVNSLAPSIRTKILRDRNPDVAMRAIDLLEEYEIPYVGSLVCWPTIPWDDIRNTVKLLDQRKCALIRYSLPAYSKHLKGRKFDRLEFWDKGVEVAKELMNMIETPLKIEPYHYFDSTYEPNVVGAIHGSPAHHAGIRPGTIIEEIEGVQILSANQALAMITRQSKKSAQITLRLRGPVEKESCILSLDDRPDGGFPYNRLKGLPGFAWGLILTDNLKFSYLKEMKREVDLANAKKVLLCSSELMQPIAQKMIAASDDFNDIDLRVEVPENNHFGGTIVLGDLLVVDDYVRFINDWIQKHGTPDLVLIPSSAFCLGEWKRDLTGRPFSDIERRTGCRVVCMEIKPLTG